MQVQQQQVPLTQAHMNANATTTYTQQQLQQQQMIAQQQQIIAQQQAQIQAQAQQQQQLDGLPPKKDADVAPAPAAPVIAAAASDGVEGSGEFPSFAQGVRGCIEIVPCGRDEHTF